MSRHWKCALSPSEFSVLDMVFDRTIGWGKVWEWISLNQFESGVWNETKVASDGTGMSKRTVQRALESLLKKEVLWKRGKQGDCNRFAINFFWEPPKREYPRGAKTFKPRGVKTFLKEDAAEKSSATYVLIQRQGEAFYEQHFQEDNFRKVKS